VNGSNQRHYHFIENDSHLSKSDESSDLIDSIQNNDPDYDFDDVDDQDMFE
jgi:hypothetical protein